MNDTISREQAIDAMAELQGRASSKGELTGISKAWKRIKQLPSIQPEIVRCKDCKYWNNKYWNNGSCECREIAVNCQDYMVGDIETEPEHFCGYAERKEITT